MSERISEGKGVEGGLEHRPLMPTWALTALGLVAVVTLIAGVVILLTGVGEDTEFNSPSARFHRLTNIEIKSIFSNASFDCDFY